MKQSFNSIFFVCAAVLVLAGCSKTNKSLTVIEGVTMGTTYTVKISGELDKEVDLKALIDQELLEFNGVFSHYMAESEISKFNRSEGAVTVSSSFRELLLLSEEVKNITRGAFDISIGPLVDLWGFGPDFKREGPPSRIKIEDLLETPWDNPLKITSSFVYKSRETRLDFSGIAKGYAVDLIVEFLEQRGLKNFFVEIGGEVKARGLSPRGKPWNIAIEVPDRNERKIFSTVPLDNLAMATSGDYRNFFESDGAFFPHIINPDNGYPIDSEVGSVTVLHRSAALADALATGLNAIGLENLSQISNEKNLKVMAIIRRSGKYEVFSSEKFQEYVTSFSE